MQFLRKKTMALLLLSRGPRVCILFEAFLVLVSSRNVKEIDEKIFVRNVSSITIQHGIKLSPTLLVILCSTSK